MSYFRILKSQLAWRDVLPSAKPAGRQADKPKLEPIDRELARRMEEAACKEEAKEIAKRKKERAAAVKALRQRRDEKQSALISVRKKITTARRQGDKDKLAALIAHMAALHLSDPLTTDLY